MSTWFCYVNDNVTGPVDPSFMRGLIQHKRIHPSTMVWTEGMADWAEAQYTALQSFFGAGPAVGVEPILDPPCEAVPRAAPLLFDASRYKDASGLSVTLQIFVVMLLLTTVAFVPLNWMEAAFYGGTADIDAAYLWYDSIPAMLQALLGLGLLGLLLGTLVVLMIWQRRTNINVRALGAQDLANTPGWAMGWFFVPILNIWKPQQVLQEIYKASEDPASWVAKADVPIVAGWWSAWLISNVLANVSTRMAGNAETPVALARSVFVALGSDVLMITAMLCLFVAVLRINRFQHIAHRRALTPQP